MEKDYSSPTAAEAARQGSPPPIHNPRPQPDASLLSTSYRFSSLTIPCTSSAFATFTAAASAPTNAGQMFRRSFSGAMEPKKGMLKRDASSQPQSETENKNQKRSNRNTSTREAEFLAMHQQYDLHMRNGNQIASGIENLINSTILLFKEHEDTQIQLQIEKNIAKDQNSLVNRLRVKMIEIKESESAAKAEVERLTKEMKDKDAALIKANEHMNNMEEQMETSKAKFAKILLHDMYRSCVQNFPLHFQEEKKAYFNRLKGEEKSKGVGESCEDDGCNDRDNDAGKDDIASGVGHAAATTKE